jgi:hypothetical protein
MGNYKSAELKFLEALDCIRNSLGETDPNIAQYLSNLSLLYQRIGANSKAEPFLIEARDSYFKDISNNISFLSNEEMYPPVQPHPILLKKPPESCTQKRDGFTRNNVYCGRAVDGIRAIEG